MKDLRVTEQEIMEFERYLRNEERERATIEKYLRDVRFSAHGWDAGLLPGKR